MKYCRFELNKEAKYGLVESVAGQDVITRVLLTTPYQSDEELEDLPSKKINSLPFANAVLLAPLQPSKIVCVGLNYR
jgi:2-keto-4-pentenoate hydratase/2-oxohepta-3-ene-1,7-dioic acid hydratase in catechol pathway